MAFHAHIMRPPKWQLTRIHIPFSCNMRCDLPIVTWTCAPKRLSTKYRRTTTELPRENASTNRIYSYIRYYMRAQKAQKFEATRHQSRELVWAPQAELSCYSRRPTISLCIGGETIASPLCAQLFGTKNQTKNNVYIWRLWFGALRRRARG